MVHEQKPSGAERIALRGAAIHIAILLLAGCQAAPRRQAVSEDPPSLRIVATDVTHEAPDTVRAGLRHVRFENHGSVIHESMFIRLPDGMSAAGYASAVAGGDAFPKGAIDCSGPGLTSPGESLDLWVELEPGRHMLACWFRHAGKDSSFRQHITQGPWHEFVVVGPVESDSAPAADAVIRLVDYRFELDREIKSGMRTVRVEMPSTTMHEMDVYRLDDQRRLADLKAWHALGRKVPPPATALGGVLDSHATGRSVWLRREFVPGHYVAWCGMDMPEGSGTTKPMTHADMGMVLEFTVTGRE